MANRDRVKLAFIHVPTEGFGAVGGRQVQGLGRVRGWMTPAPGWLWQVKCVGGIVWQTDAGLDWRQHSLAGWLASSSSGGDKQAAAAAAAAESSAHYSHSHNRAQTAQPEDLGRDAGGARAGVRGWSMGDGVQRKPTWVRRLPPIRVGWLVRFEGGITGV